MNTTLAEIIVGVVIAAMLIGVPTVIMADARRRRDTPDGAETTPTPTPPTPRR